MVRGTVQAIDQVVVRASGSKSASNKGSRKRALKVHFLLSAKVMVTRLHHSTVEAMIALTSLQIPFWGRFISTGSAIISSMNRH